MTELDYILPEETGFKGVELDDYLSMGYFRMLHMLFTTFHIEDELTGKPVPVYWVRNLVNKIYENRDARRIRKKCSEYTFSYTPAVITDEIEELYNRYRNHVDFSLTTSCYDYLHVNYIEDPFDSWMIELRDQSKLIAVGFFDTGKESISGILNVYDPDYIKNSLGKYLILKIIDYALANGIPYFYTGYISSASAKFDYKTFPDQRSMEVYLPIEKIWVPYASYGKENLGVYYLKNNFLE
jgi:arginine-tRNA-protein transferase